MLADKSYVPILKTNVAEMSAYRVLFPSVKPLVFPLFLFRPWQNANDLNMAVEKVQEAVEGHPFALCLDARKRGYSSKRAAQADFDARSRPSTWCKFGCGQRAALSGGLGCNL